jgi:membrane protein implicated in regulation of membrane protease activity
MSMEFYQISISVGIAFIIIEMFTLTYIFLGMGIASFAVALIQYLFDGLSFNRDLMIFAIISAIVILASRKIFKKKSDQSISTEDDVNQY